VPNDLYSRPLSKGILDGQLLSNFVDLSVSRQRELLEPIGTDRETVLNDISELSGMW
jgi:cleavage and polyadenylation specificity factor subunit 1